MWNPALLAVKLLQIPRIGHRATYEILNALKEFYNDIDDQLLNEIVTRRFVRRKPQDDVNKYLIKGNEIYEATLDRGFKFVSIFDNSYPKKLRRLRYPPVVVNYAGDLSFCNELVTVTLAGTRHPTEHGYNISMRLAELFAERNCAIIAGLAAGCGTAIHLGCLKAHGKTGAIVGHGLAHVYPRENVALSQRIIASGGAIMSARFLDEKPRAEFFVERNLLQGGISDFLVITQTRPGSGTRHIVEAANQCGNKVYIYNPPDRYNDPSFDENKSLVNKNAAVGISTPEDINRCLREFEK